MVRHSFLSCPAMSYERSKCTTTQRSQAHITTFHIDGIVFSSRMSDALLFSSERKIHCRKACIDAKRIQMWLRDCTCRYPPLKGQHCPKCCGIEWQLQTEVDDMFTLSFAYIFFASEQMTRRDGHGLYCITSTTSAKASPRGQHDHSQRSLRDCPACHQTFPCHWRLAVMPGS